jgi:iron transport multicopper oxidase
MSTIQREESVWPQLTPMFTQTDVEESPIDLLTVTVAQRYSVLVTARNDTSLSNWAIHAAMDVDMFDTVPDGLNPNATSSITYNVSAPITDNGFIPLEALHDVNDTALVPVEVIPQLPPAGKTIEVEVRSPNVPIFTRHFMVTL